MLFGMIVQVSALPTRGAAKQVTRKQIQATCRFAAPTSFPIPIRCQVTYRVAGLATPGFSGTT